MGRNKSPRVDYWRLKQNPQLQKRLAKRYPRTMRRKAEREAKAEAKRARKAAQKLVKEINKIKAHAEKMEEKALKDAIAHQYSIYNRRVREAAANARPTPKLTHSADWYINNASKRREEYRLKLESIQYFDPDAGFIKYSKPQKQLGQARRLYDSYEIMRADVSSKDPWEQYLERVSKADNLLKRDKYYGLPMTQTFNPTAPDPRRFERFGPTYGSELYNTAGEFYLDKYGQMHRKGNYDVTIDWDKLAKGKTSTYWSTEKALGNDKQLEKMMDKADNIEEFWDSIDDYIDQQVDDINAKYEKEQAAQQAFEEKLAAKEARDIAKWEKEHQPTTDADRLNDMFEYASDKFGNRDDYQKYLAPLLGELMGDEFYRKLLQDPKSLIGDYEYFTIDDGYRVDNKDNLFKHIHFKDIPAGFDDYIEQMEVLDWSSPENYAMHHADVQRGIYESNLKSLYETDNIVDDTYFVMLEAVMQSSAAWEIAKRSAFDSDQTQSNWFDLYMTGSLAYDHKDTDPHIWDAFRQMVDNHEALFIIEDKIDEMIIKATKEG